ncbi:unnamed protein product [Closterium sp. NIES-53]
MYLMTCTRPDLAYPLSLLARYVAPGRHRKVHWDAAKRVLRYLCSTSGMGLVLGGRARVLLIGHADASWADDLATQRSSQGYTFSLGSGSVSWRSTRSSSVLSSSCEAEIYAGAMAAQELRLLTYLLTDLGEAPGSTPVLYVNNKAMLALCQEHRLEHRTKHIALRYFLARKLQQRGQLRLAYMASQANTADVFTKALQPCDHQRFCTVLGLQVLGTPTSTGLIPPLLCPPPDHSQPPLQPASPLPPPSPYTEQSGGLTERREPASRPVSPVRTTRHAPHSRPPLVPGTHAMELRPSSSNRARAVSPAVSCLLATVVTDPSFESAAASALVAEPPSVGGECALGTDVLEDRQEEFECLAVAVPRFASMLLAPEGDPDAPDIPTPRSYAEAITGPYSSQWQVAMDVEMASWKSTGTYADEVPPPGANIVDSMWIFRVKRPPGSPPAFKARYVARDFSQRQGVDYFQTFSPTPKMTTLRVLLHVAAQRDYKLHSLDFSTTFLQGILHDEIWLRRPPGFSWTNTLAALGFAPSTADPSLFLRTDTSLPPFYALVYVDDLVFATADTEALTLVKSELQKRHTCTDLGELHSYLGLQITRDRARRTIALT